MGMSLGGFSGMVAESVESTVSFHGHRNVGICIILCLE